MASKKKQSEGIALLSMYNDEEDDDMEDVEENLAAAGQEGEEQGDDRDARAAEDVLVPETNRMDVSDSAAPVTPPLGNDGMTPEKTKFRSSTPQQPSVNEAVSPKGRRAVSSDSRRIRRGALTIVDYGHDEVAMSPEPEDSVSTVGAHAAILSSANAGGGYLLYAQQKRREAEEGKRSRNRRSDLSILSRVDGIGDVNAAKLVSKFGTLERLLECVDQITEERIKEALIANAEQALLSKELALLRSDLPFYMLPFTPKDLSFKKPEDNGDRLKGLLSAISAYAEGFSADPIIRRTFHLWRKLDSR